VQKPHPPLWVGGHSRAALRRAARHGAAWHPINRTPAEMRAGRAELARQCQTQGRATPPALAPRHDVCVLGPAQPARPSARPGHALVGEPPAVVEQLHELADCGAEHVVLEFLAADAAELDAQLVAFAERIRPHLR
jgi:alkanesulfonate monooxygenase SsuD/methylene tetrahydromethanopterin reductase-like flavin-dependent oxidoreductase (luciferase family)